MDGTTSLARPRLHMLRKTTPLRRPQHVHSSSRSRPVVEHYDMTAQNPNASSARAQHRNGLPMLAVCWPPASCVADGCGAALLRC